MNKSNENEHTLRAVVKALFLTVDIMLELHRGKLFVTKKN